MSAKRLYRVELEWSAYVLADSEREAIDEAKDGIKAQYQDPDWEHADEVIAAKTNLATHIEPDWESGRPYGGDANDDRTVGEIVEELKRAEGAKEGGS